jgi:hypothetical protein
MLNAGAVQSVVFAKDNSHIVMADGSTIPLHWDGRLFHLHQLTASTTEPLQTAYTAAPASCAIEDGEAQWQDYLLHFSELFRDERVQQQHSWRKVCTRGYVAVATSSYISTPGLLA